MNGGSGVGGQTTENGQDILPPNDWSQRADLIAMLAVLDPDGDQCRYVGGAVRDTLLGLVIKDIDIATRILPHDVMARLKAAGYKVIPTGIDHGTVTVVLANGAVEITTLRADIATDGRRATVAFSDDWREDAARRDFTVNALYADPISGRLYDYFGGLDDLKAAKLRFIGDADQRICEDYLRILRFFRFDARFAQSTAPDAAAMAACARHAASLKALSRERIAMELLNMLPGDGMLRAFNGMAITGIWPHILPEIRADAGDALNRLITRESHCRVNPQALVRLAAIVPADADMAKKLATRLRFSRQQMNALVRLVGGPQPDAHNIREIMYRMGEDVARSRIALYAKDTDLAAILAMINNWSPPEFPYGGRDIMAHGISAGPMVSKALAMVERDWIDQGFPQGTALDAIAAKIVADIKR